jgi:hypothetical protein
MEMSNTNDDIDNSNTQASNVIENNDIGDDDDIDDEDEEEKLVEAPPNIEQADFEEDDIDWE